MSFVEKNKAYEAWLKTQCYVVKCDLEYKHHRMAKDAFHFLRATNFRWSDRIESLLPELASAPSVLSYQFHIKMTWLCRGKR